MMNLPNTLTMARLALAPVLGWLVASGEGVLAAALFAVVAVTDALDGWFARRRGQVTALGQLLDPLADKALVNATFVAAASTGVLPWWLALLVLARDGLILAGAALTRTFRLGHSLLPLAIGKVSTAVQMTAMTVLLALGASGRAEPGIMRPLIAAVAVVTVASGASYAYAWLRHVFERRAGARRDFTPSRSGREETS